MYPRLSAESEFLLRQLSLGELMQSIHVCLQLKCVRAKHTYFLYSTVFMI